MKSLQECRIDIDRIDAEIQRLFEERMTVVAEVADYKKANHLPVFDAVREEEKIVKMRAQASDESLADGIEQLYRTVFSISKGRENERIDHETH